MRGRVETDNLFARLPDLKQGDERLSKKGYGWIDYIEEVGLNIEPYQIRNVPWSDISLRNASREHKASVGSNSTVHMSNRNGVSDWIRTMDKVNTHGDWYRRLDDPLQRTSLALKIYGAQAGLGDPGVTSSGAHALLSEGALALPLWMQRDIESRMPSYFINNGNIAGGQANYSSHSVMTADFGYNDIPVRSELRFADDVILPSVQHLGTYQLDNYHAMQDFTLGEYNRATRESNYLVQRIEWTPTLDVEGVKTNVKRTSDAVLVEFDQNIGKLLIVEGVGINKKGQIVDLESNEPIVKLIDINLSKESQAANKKTYDAAVKQYDEAIDLIRTEDGRIAGSISDVAEIMYKNYNDDVGIAIINTQQPRNMIGDTVLNKVLVYEKDGKVVSSSDPLEGNVSRQNHRDAIMPQDRDFDFDTNYGNL